MGRNKKYKFMLLVMVSVLILAYFINDSYYKSLMEMSGVENEAGKILDYHFDMIVDNSPSTFWNAVYQSGRKTAEENNAILELKGVDEDSSYDKIDYMNMSIAAHSDGIILENNGEDGLAEKIDEAVQEGIPVVTVMSDASYSQRQSFVGVSDYQLGAAYAEQVATFVGEDTEDILILTKRNMDDKNQSQIYSQIYNSALEQCQSPERLTVTVQNLLTTGAFDAEEAIRDIFQKEMGPPDMLVCMDEETTECARQALIDFNMADQVKIIGYYTSDNILDAVDKGLICATCSIDTQQMGQYSVQALIDYKNEGRASSYFNVDIHFVGAEEARSLERKRRNEEISVE